MALLTLGLCQWLTQVNHDGGVMNIPINAKRLRATLPDVVERVRKGTRFTVIYRSRPAFQIVPVDDNSSAPISLADDPLYHAQPVGSSDDGRTSIDHDAILYLR
jgi:antitoxin (DNA-binding transcriptional repressor) of toxin-antitoxin stability system